MSLRDEIKEWENEVLLAALRWYDGREETTRAIRYAYHELTVRYSRQQERDAASHGSKEG